MKKRGKQTTFCNLSNQDIIKIILILLLLIFLTASPWAKTFWQFTGELTGNTIIENFFRLNKKVLYSPEEQMLLAHYSFENNADDTTGNYHGTTSGDPVFTEGLSGQALQLDGINDYINLGNELANPDTYGGAEGAVTFSAWIKPDDVDKYNFIIQGTGFRYISAGATRKQQGKIRAMVKDTTNMKNYWPLSKNQINPNKWTHITFIFKGGQGYKIYINGQLDKEVAEPNIKLYKYLTKAYIGLGVSSGTYFKGLIDEVKIWNYGLSEEEIQAEYEKNTPPDITIPEQPTEKKLLAHYSFEDNVNDITDNNYDGTPLGNPAYTLGISGQALQLDGINDYIDLGNELANPDTYGGAEGAVTFSAWVKPDDVDKHNMIVQGTGFRYLSAGASGRYLRKIRAMVKDTTNNKNFWPTSKSQINPTNWTHIVFIFEGGQGYKIYINGDLDNEVTEPNIKLYPYLTEASLGLGTSEETYFKGSVDEVKIWNYVLTDEDIKTEYENADEEEAEPSPSEIKITNQLSTKNSFSMSGDKLVWKDISYKEDGSYIFKIYLYDFSTGQTMQIPHGGGDDLHYPRISGNKIIWIHTDWLYGGGRYFVVHDLLTGSRTKLGEYKGTVSYYGDEYGEITSFSGDKFVYGEKFRNEDNSYSYYVSLYDLSSNRKTNIRKVTSATSSQSQQINPVIDGNKVVWFEKIEDPVYVGLYYDHIYMYDISTKTETLITDDGNIPSIYEDKIVWAKSSSIYLHDLSTAQTTEIKTSLRFPSHPKIYKNIIVWHDSRNGNADILMYDLSTNKESQITTDISNQKDPIISENKIAWLDYRHGTYTTAGATYPKYREEIYMIEL